MSRSNVMVVGMKHSYEIHFVNYTNKPLLRTNNKGNSCKLNNRRIFKQQSQLTQQTIRKFSN